MAYFVYELCSESKKQRYIGYTRALDVEVGMLRRSPPIEIAKWPKDDREKPRILEVCANADEARSFIHRHLARVTVPSGWEVLVSAV